MRTTPPIYPPSRPPSFSNLDCDAPALDESTLVQVDSEDMFESGKEFEHADLSSSFDIQAARENYDYRPALDAFQEIALQNSKPIRLEEPVYIFERGQERYTLDQAFQALSLEGAVNVSVSKAHPNSNQWRFIPEREYRVRNLGELCAWWVREKSHSQL